MSHSVRGGSLLPWVVTGEEMVQPATGIPAASAAQPPLLSLVDRLAAPLSFMHQALVFERPLDADRLREALAQSLVQFPTLACRAAQDANGDWKLCQPHAGAMLSIGRSAVPLCQLAPQPPLPPAAPLADLGGELFGHLEGASLVADSLPLLQVTLVTLHSNGLEPGSRGASSSTAATGGSSAGAAAAAAATAAAASGGCILGLRASHLVADFGTLRGLLHHLAAAYSGRPLCGSPQPAEPLIAALAAVPPPAGTQPYNYLLWPPDFMEKLATLAAAPLQHGLTLHFPPARLAALKAQAVAEAAAITAAAPGGAGASAEDGTEPAWVSTNDALMAWLWKAFAALPCRRGAVTAFNQGLDMRGRLPPPPARAAAPAPGEAEPQAPPAQALLQPGWVYGNLATSAYTPPLDVAGLPLGAVARALRRTVISDAAKFAPDMAHVGKAVADGARCSQYIILPVLRLVEDAAAGRPAPVFVSQCTLDYAADADFRGQLPVAAVPTFGRMVIPVAHSQPAPPAAGGGVLVHLWLPEEQACELAAAAEAAAAEATAAVAVGKA